jgi:hypothetical protein
VPHVFAVRIVVSAAAAKRVSSGSYVVVVQQSASAYHAVGLTELDSQLQESSTVRGAGAACVRNSLACSGRVPLRFWLPCMLSAATFLSALRCNRRKAEAGSNTWSL